MEKKCSMNSRSQADPGEIRQKIIIPESLRKEFLSTLYRKIGKWCHFSFCCIEESSTNALRNFSNAKTKPETVCARAGFKAIMPIENHKWSIGYYIWRELAIEVYGKPFNFVLVKILQLNIRRKERNNGTVDLKWSEYFLSNLVSMSNLLWNARWKFRISVLEY